ncbi:MAG TPA: hypothetical protein VJ731_11605 [Terriglobales bacterium]|nr:hypothetical protein [Terriglobales bacterium]
MGKFVKLNVIAVFSAFLLLGWSVVLAQQPGKSGAQQGGMKMDDMMKSCQQHCQRTTASIDQLTKEMEEAKQSNDPAKMRKALEDAQKPLADMKNHMSMCMNMMDMMQKMGNMPGMMPESGAKGKK